MTDDPTQRQCRERLLQWRKELGQAERSGRDAERPVELDPSRLGRLSRIDALQAQAMSRETGQRRRQALRQVEAALLRLERGEFGACRTCGEAIDPRRLLADPVVTRCIGCAAAAES